MPKQLLIFPFGGNAREALLSVFAVNDERQEWEIVGFFDDDPKRKGESCCGIKVLGGRDILEDFPEAKVLAVPGNPQNFHRRQDIIDSLQLDESRFASIIHPSAVVAPDAVVGCNALVMSNVVLSCGVEIGKHCLFLPNTVVSHDSTIGDSCCLGSNISVSGSVRIGPSCYVGSGTKIREGITIGAGTLVGLGANVVSDLEPGVIAVGSPARPIRKRSDQGLCA